MKFLVLIILSLFMQSSDCDNKEVLSKMFWGYDITKSNEELVSKFKSDTRFYDYSKTSEEFGPNSKIQSDNFRFSEHSLIKKGGIVCFLEKSKGIKSLISFCIAFETDNDVNKAFATVCSEFDNGCFEKIQLKADEVEYKDKNFSINIDKSNFDPSFISLSIRIARK